MFEGQGHADIVSAVLGDPVGPASGPALVAATERALDAIWQVATPILGEVTILAVVDRVLCNTAEVYPFVNSLTVKPTGVDFSAMLKRLQAIPSSDLTHGCRKLLTDLLTVLGTLTAEILTPALHTALARVRPASGPDQGQPGHKPLTNEDGGR